MFLGPFLENDIVMIFLAFILTQVLKNAGRCNVKTNPLNLKVGMLIIGSWCIISVWRGANTPIGGNRESGSAE